MSIERKEHDVTIYAKGCHTTRECFCLATNGFSHHEDDSPWVVDRQGHFERSDRIEEPPEIPFLKGEDFEEYRERIGYAVVWKAAYQAGLDDAADHAKGLTSGRTNPYLDEES